MVILIRQPSDTPIRPRDIDVDEGLADAFSGDAEVAAHWIVRYCQTRRTWAPFGLATFRHYADTYYIDAKCQIPDGIEALVDSGLVRSEAGNLTLTSDFVASCYKAAPVQGMPRKKRRRIKRRPDDVSRFQMILEK